MTDAELNVLFDFTNTSSLAYAYLNETKVIHDFHGCAENTTNCTADEIATQQWGSSNITKDFYAPYKTTPYLSDTGISVTDVWGIIPKESEYFYYAK